MLSSIVSWVIEEANWMSLVKDLRAVVPEGGFDAVVCLGNSFAHLPDWHGDQRDHRFDYNKDGAASSLTLPSALAQLVIYLA